MAMTNQQQTDAYRFFVIAFGATPGVEYMNQLDEAYTFGLTTQEIVNIYTTKPAFNAQYPTFFSAEQFANALIANVVGNSASDAAKAEAKADIIGALNAGLSRGDVIYNVFTNLANALTTPDVPEEGPWYDTALMLANKVEVARYATEVLLINEADQSILRNVTADPASVAAAKDVLLGTGGDPVLTFSLSVGQDGIDGNGSNNIFKANVVQNSLGQQVNTLGSGDVLDGGAGIDTLNAKITAGVYAGGGNSSMPIQPETTSVEIVNLQAVNSGIASTPEVTQVVSLTLGEIIAGLTGGTPQFDPLEFFSQELPILTVREVVTQGAAISTEVYVNAKDMVGVTDIGSVHSDANLTIQNMTTQGLTQLSDMTIHMEYSGNKDTRWNESDLHVYFDQDYLTPEATSTKPTVQFLAMNEDAYDQAERDGKDPQSNALDGVFFRELQFTMNGQKFDLKPFLGENENGAGGEIKSYTQFLAAVQSALVQLKAANPGNAALQTVTAKFGDTFTTDANPDTLILRKGTAIELSVDGLTNGVANTLVVVPKDLEVARAATATVDNNNRYELASVSPSKAGTKLGINVALEKVGLAGDGGELVIGSMNKHTDNVWDAVNTTADGTTSGINEFYVTVFGNSTKSSSLSGLHSTNNNLRVVTVATDAAQTTGKAANLTIGNSNTGGDFGQGFLGFENALKDVQVFDASAFKGNLTLFAALTDEVTAKYLNLQDTGAPAADNLNFEYTGGTGNDNINLTISANNGAFSGAATREDFLMNATINGGDGNDFITLAIVDNEGNSFFDEADDNGLAYGIDNPGALPSSGYANWYDNQKLMANLRIDGGKGNDTIWTPGSGDVIIDGGVGNDTVYADNTGDKAVWAFNFASGAPSRKDLNNLQSDMNDKYKVFKTDVKVNYLGFEVNARIADKNGVASDLDINQAIKKAINDPNGTLSKLLVATDGPANTLVVASRIDGERYDGDLEVTLVSPAASALSAGDLNSLASWYGAGSLTAAQAVALIDAQVALFNGNAVRVGGGNVYNQDFANDGLFGTNPIDGDESDHTSDNHITGGLGNDVLVLGTGEHSNDTVAYKLFGNGIDSIVNFTASDAYTDEYVYLHAPYVQGAAAVTAVTAPVAEKFTVQFGPTTGAGTVVFDGITVNYLAAPLTGAAAAAQFATVYNAGGGTYTAVATGDKIVFTETTPAGLDIIDVQVSDFVLGAPTVSGAIVAVLNNVDGDTVITTPGVTAVTETFTLHFDTNPNATTYTFDGETIPVLAGELGTNIAQAVATGNYTNWTAALSGANDVIFTAKTLLTNVPDAAPFGGIISQVFTGFADNSDYMDFSAYNAKAVYVGGVLVAGSATTALGQTYITLTESTTNVGEYTMKQMIDAGVVGTAGDTTVDVIGVADFGAHQAFVAQNFIL